MDVASQWSRVDVNHDVEYPATTSKEMIIADLAGRGYLYSAVEPPYCSNMYGSQGYSHFIILDSSAGAGIGSVFDVGTSIDLSPNAPDNRIMKGLSAKWVKRE